jgi:CHAD domain-containing protein
MAKAKEVEGLDCGAEALEGIRLVLRTRFAEMYDVRAAALDREEIKGVHDMRVASRRLRSALRDFKEFLDGKGFPKRRLKKVAAALGEVRDEDVAIAALRDIRSQTDGEVAAGIERLLSERSRQRERARQRLESVITVTKLAELQQRFLVRLESDSRLREKRDDRRVRGTTKALSFGQAGRKVIKSRLAELLDLSESLHHPFKMESLHSMRIAAKRLRYAMELFAPCWGGQLSSYAHEVAELQGSLGDLCDCDNWIADLGARLDRQRRSALRGGQQPADTQLREAAIWLLQYFTKEHGRHFGNALTRWREWETTGFFRRMIASLED